MPSREKNQHGPKRRKPSKEGWAGAGMVAYAPLVCLGDGMGKRRVGASCENPPTIRRGLKNLAITLELFNESRNRLDMVNPEMLE